MPDDPLPGLNLARSIHVFIGLLIIYGSLGRQFETLHHLHETGVHQRLDKLGHRLGGLVQDKLYAITGCAERGAILTSGAPALLQHGIHGYRVGPAEIDPHGAIDATDNTDMKLVAARTIQTPKTYHQFWGYAGSKRPIQLLRGFTRIADEQTLRTEIGDLTRPGFTGSQINLGGKLDWLAGAATTFSRIHELPDISQSRNDHRTQRPVPAHVPETMADATGCYYRDHDCTIAAWPPQANQSTITS